MIPRQWEHSGDHSGGPYLSHLHQEASLCVGTEKLRSHPLQDLDTGLINADGVAGSPLPHPWPGEPPRLA